MKERTVVFILLIEFLICLSLGAIMPYPFAIIPSVGLIGGGVVGLIVDLMNERKNYMGLV